LARELIEAETYLADSVRAAAMHRAALRDTRALLYNSFNEVVSFCAADHSPGFSPTAPDLE
jgi:hypothetical protein